LRHHNPASAAHQHQHPTPRSAPTQPPPPPPLTENDRQQPARSLADEILEELYGETKALSADCQRSSDDVTAPSTASANEIPLKAEGEAAEKDGKEKEEGQIVPEKQQESAVEQCRQPARGGKSDDIPYLSHRHYINLI
jgi:hypothetical protein